VQLWLQFPIRLDDVVLNSFLASVLVEISDVFRSAASCFSLCGRYVCCSAVTKFSLSAKLLLVLAGHSSCFRVPLDSWLYFTVSDSRLPQPGEPGPCIYVPSDSMAQLYRPRQRVPFPSPSTTHRAAVDVFWTAYTREYVSRCLTDSLNGSRLLVAEAKLLPMWKFLSNFLLHRYDSKVSEPRYSDNTFFSETQFYKPAYNQFFL
jgi:hypothetical protein